MALSDAYQETLGGLTNSLNRASNTFLELQEADNKSTLKQLLAYQNSIYSNFDPQNPDNEGYVQQLARTYDESEFDALEQQFTQKMYDKMDELKVNAQVRKMWEQDYLPTYKQNLNEAKYKAYMDNYANKIAQKWGTFAGTVRDNSNLDYKAKKEALTEYWDENLKKVEQYVDLKSIDEMMEDLLPNCITQGVDSFYATNPNTTMPESQVAEYVLNSIKSQLPEDKPLDADTEFSLRQTAQKQAAAHESQMQSIADENIGKMATDLLQRSVNGETITATEILQEAGTYGAYVTEADGTKVVSKYWTTYLSKFVSQAESEMQLEEEKKQAQAAADAATAESERQWTEIGKLTTDDWMSLAVDITQSGLVDLGIEEKSDKVNFDRLKGDKKTYNFGAATEITYYSKLAGAMAEKLGITDTTSDQFRELVRQANAIGDYYEYVNDIDKRNAEIEAENAVNAEAETQFNKVLNLTEADWTSAMVAIGGGAEQTYDAYTGAISSGYITDYKAFQRKEEYSFDDGTSAETEYGALVEEVAAQQGITNKKSVAFKALVLQANMRASNHEFDDPNAAKPATKAEQVAAVATLTTDDIMLAAQEVISGEPFLPTATTTANPIATTPAAQESATTAPEKAEETTPAATEKTQPEAASIAQQAPAESAEPENESGGPISATQAVTDSNRAFREADKQQQTVETQVDSSVYHSPLEVFMGESGLNVSSLSKDKTYSFEDGTSLTTAWSPVVERIAAKYGITDPDALKLLVNVVDQMGEGYWFSDPSKDYVINNLKSLRLKGVTNDEYHAAVLSAVASKALTPDELKEAGLLSDKSLYEEYSGKAELEKNLLTELKIKYYGFDTTNKKVASKQDEVGNSAQYEHMEQKAIDLLEVYFNSDPAAFTTKADQNKAIQQIVQQIYDKQLHDDIAAAYNKIWNHRIGTNYHSGFSADNTNIQDLMEGIYNPGWITNSDGVAYYKDFTGYIVPSVKTAADTYLAEIRGNTNFNWDSDFSWDDAKQKVTNAVTPGKKFEQLSPSDQDAISMCLILSLYESDFKRTTAERFGINADSCILGQVKGLGICLVDPKTGYLYSCDSDVKTSSRYNVAALPKEKTLQMIVAYENGEPVSIGRDEVLDYWIYEGESAKDIRGYEEAKKNGTTYNKYTTDETFWSYANQGMANLTI